MTNPGDITNPANLTNNPMTEYDDEQVLREVSQRFLGPELESLRREVKELKERDNEMSRTIQRQAQTIKQHSIAIQLYEKLRVSSNRTVKSLECKSVESKSVQTDVTGLPYRVLPQEEDKDTKPVFFGSDSKRRKTNTLSKTAQSILAKRDQIKTEPGIEFKPKIQQPMSGDGIHKVNPVVKEEYPSSYSTPAQKQSNRTSSMPWAQSSNPSWSQYRQSFLNAPNYGLSFGLIPSSSQNYSGMSTPTTQASSYSNNTQEDVVMDSTDENTLALVRAALMAVKQEDNNRHE